MSKLARRAALRALPLAFLLAAAAPDPAPVPKLDTAALADPGTFRDPKLSPDGTHLLARMFTNGKTGLAVAELAGKGLELIALPDDYDLIRYAWAGDGRILITMGGKTVWYDRGEKYITRVFVYDLASGSVKLVGPKVQNMRGDDLIWVDPKGAEALMVSQDDQYHYPSVYRINLANGKASLEQGPYDNIWFWSADNAGNLRAGIGIMQNGWFVTYRRSGKGGYTKSPQISWDADDNIDAWRLNFDSDEGYVIANKGTGRAALYKYNFATRQMGDKVFDSPTNDIDDYDFDNDTHSLIDVTYADDRDRIAWFDPKMKTVQANLDKTFGAGRSAFVVSRSRDRSRMAVWAGSPTDPGAYYIYDAATGGLSRLAKVADKVDRAGLSPTTYVHYKARDGLDIPAYLTLPVGRDPKRLPLIIMPHGGPFGIRDKLDYDSEVQLLANRGYVVLQPNYRGSGGYGSEFDAKGEGQWGRAMQDDLDDGMDWAVAQGYADAKRVCLVGGSYGGYAALWGATRNPERYRCAVSFAGVSDLKAQLDFSSDFFLSKKSRRKFGNKVQGDKSFDLDTISPLRTVDRLKVPVMLVHGDKDSTVPLKQSTLYDKALTAAGKPHEMYVYPGAGHGFTKAADEKDYMDKLDAFLAKHNPA